MNAPRDPRFLAAWFFALALVGCVQQPDGENRAAEEERLRQTDIAWSKAAEAGDVEAHSAYFLEDAVVLAPNEPLVRGREAIRAMVAQFFEMPGFSVRWQPAEVGVSASGDMGYTVGTVEMTLPGPDGTSISDPGKYATVWKKQADGSWKVAVDMFNSNAPAP